MYTMVLTDIIKRWQVLSGRKALLLTGTDEHGMKVIGILNLDIEYRLTYVVSIDSASGSKGTE